MFRAEPPVNKYNLSNFVPACCLGDKWLATIRSRVPHNWLARHASRPVSVGTRLSHPGVCLATPLKASQVHFKYQIIYQPRSSSRCIIFSARRSNSLHITWSWKNVLKLLSQVFFIANPSGGLHKHEVPQ